MTNKRQNWDLNLRLSGFHFTPPPSSRLRRPQTARQTLFVPLGSWAPGSNGCPRNRGWSPSPRPRLAQLVDPSKPVPSSPTHCHHLSLWAQGGSLRKLTLSVATYTGSKLALAGWRGPSPKAWISCNLRQHFAQPDRVLSQGQSNQPLRQQS